MPSAALPLSHILLALAVVIVWGTNFVVIRIGLDHLPPLFFATLRFVFAFLPAALLLRRPAVPIASLAGYGMLIGGQFALLFVAIRGFISPGLASLVVQVQVFITIGLSVWRAGERIGAAQIGALALAAAGIGVIAVQGDGAATVAGLVLVVGAAASWAVGNIVARESGASDILPFVVWSSVFAVPPLLGASLLLEGPAAIRAGLAAAGPFDWAAVLWQAVGNTLFGYASWAWLLARHPAAAVSPFALLVPVFGMGASSLWLGEPLPAWKLGAAALVMAGLVLGLLLPVWQARAAPRVPR